MGNKTEPSRLDEIVAREGDGLFRFLFWALGQREDALDALQEVLIRVHRGLPALREEGSLKRWIYRIATNVARDARSRRRKVPASFGLSAAEDANAALHGSSEPQPSARLEALESDSKLAKALGTLEPELREPLLMFASGLRYREIAEALGWPIGTVSTRVHAAREKLAKLLGP